jgi:hypothetical protein
MSEEKRVCDSCGKELQPGDSIVFTPDGSSAEKHLCMACFEKMGTASA